MTPRLLEQQMFRETSFPSATSFGATSERSLLFFSRICEIGSITFIPPDQNVKHLVVGGWNVELSLIEIFSRSQEFAQPLTSSIRVVWNLWKKFLVPFILYEFSPLLAIGATTLDDSRKTLEYLKHGYDKKSQPHYPSVFTASLVCHVPSFDSVKSFVSSISIEFQKLKS